MTAMDAMDATMQKQEYLWEHNHLDCLPLVFLSLPKFKRKIRRMHEYPDLRSIQSTYAKISLEFELNEIDEVSSPKKNLAVNSMVTREVDSMIPQSLHMK